MNGVGRSQASSGDMSLLYPNTVKYAEAELRKNREFIDSDFHHHQQQDHHYYSQQHNTGLMRYRSAPSSVFANLVDGGDDLGYEYFSQIQSTSLESDNMLSRLMSCNGSSDADSCSVQERTNPQFVVAMKQEEAESVSQQNSYSSVSPMIFRSPPMQTRDSVSGISSMGSGNCSNLVRQSSSPAGFFNNIAIDNGFAVRDDGIFRTGSGANCGEANLWAGRLNNHMKFSKGPSRFMPQIPEIGNESLLDGSAHENGVSGNGDGSGRCYMPSFPGDSWDDCTVNTLKKIRNNDGKMFCSINSLEGQNGNSGNHATTGLTHHLSLPKASTETAFVEKILQFQDSVPCKIRAKRGCATHPRSIAERMRRTRISERMRKLQELFPNMDKQTNTADMLELAVEYIKNLQKQVKTLTDTRARCTCLSKQHK